jgi:hypothetical protein
MALAQRQASSSSSFYEQQPQQRQPIGGSRPTRSFGALTSTRPSRDIGAFGSSRPTRTIEAYALGHSQQIAHPTRSLGDVTQNGRPTRSLGAYTFTPPTRTFQKQEQKSKLTNMNNFQVSPSLDFKTIARQLAQAPTQADYEAIQVNALSHALPTTVIAVTPISQPIEALMIGNEQQEQQQQEERQEQQQQDTQTQAPQQKSIWFNLGFNMFKQMASGVVMNYGKTVVANALGGGVAGIAGATVLMPLLLATANFVIEKNKNITMDAGQRQEFVNGVKAGYISAIVSGGIETITGGTSGFFTTALDMAVKGEIASVGIGSIVGSQHVPIDPTKMQPRHEQINVEDYKDSKKSLALALAASVAATMLIGGGAVPVSGYAKTVFDSMGGSKTILNNAVGLGRTAADRIFRRSGLSENPGNEKLRKLKDDLAKKLAERFLHRGVKTKLLYNFASNIASNTASNLATGYIQQGVLEGKWASQNDIYKDFTTSKANLVGAWNSLAATGSATFENLMKFTGNAAPAINNSDPTLDASPEKMLQEQQRMEDDFNQFEHEFQDEFEKLRNDMFQEAEITGEAIDLEAMKLKQIQAVKSKLALQGRSVEGVSALAGNLVQGDSIEKGIAEGDVNLYHNRGLAAGQDVLLQWNMAARELASRLKVDIKALSEDSIAEFIENQPSKLLPDSLRDVQVTSLVGDPTTESLPPEIVDALNAGPKVEASLEFDQEAVDVMQMLTAGAISNDRLMASLTPGQQSALKNMSAEAGAAKLVAALTADNLAKDSLGLATTLEDVTKAVKNAKDIYVNSDTLEDVLGKVDNLRDAAKAQQNFADAKRLLENVESDANGIAFGRLLEGVLHNREEATRGQVLYELVYGRTSGREIFGK